jgi:hypothetical protein
VTQRQQFADVLSDIADSYMSDPDQRRALISDVLEALDEVFPGLDPEWSPDAADSPHDRSTQT